LEKNTSVSPEAAARLATLLPRERLDAAVLAWANAVARSGIWGVGLSGGADSVALLLLLWAHWPKRRNRLRALHFDHRLRGAESLADARFCRRVCATLGVRLVSGTWNDRRRKGASEAEARAARLAFFRKHARVVWLGHQQDDIAESMLMRLARGSGTGGLAAPRPVQHFADGRVHLRPLLTLKKAEIAGALREAGVAWREDSSNASDGFFRNRIRWRVMPVWVEAAGRDAAAGAARSRKLLEEDDSALEAWLDGLAPIDAQGRLSLGRLQGCPRALWRRALHRWLARHPATGEPSRQAVDALLAEVEQGARARQSLGKRGFAVSDGRYLRYEETARGPRRIRRRAN
jgi:tRNA(Ile)-lysidine synthase